MPTAPWTLWLKNIFERHGVSLEKLVPNWDAQVIRMRVPCLGTNAFEWHRIGEVVSSGELMQALGKGFTAKQVYYFYRTLRIVALKRPKKSQAPKSASAAVGMSVSGHRASQLRREENKHQLMNEYAAVKGVVVEETVVFFSTRPSGGSTRTFCGA